jgi:hypothetical protein
VCHTVRRLNQQTTFFKPKSSPPRISMCDHSVAPFRTQICGSRHWEKQEKFLQGLAEVTVLFVVARANGDGVV